MWSALKFNSGPIFSNNVINDLFLFFKTTKVCSFADDNTIYICVPNSSKVTEYTENDII